MSSNNKDNLAKQKLADAIFSYVGACHIDNISKEIINSNESIINPKEKDLDQVIQNYIKNYRKKQRYQIFLKTSKRISKKAAIILVVGIILTTILVSSVDALRVKFLNMFIEKKDDYSKIAIEKDNSKNGSIDILMNSEKLENCYIPAYVPEEFTVEKVIHQNDIIKVIFRDTGSSSLVFEQSSDLNREYMVNTENAFTEKISIQGQEAIIIIKDKITIVLWENNEKVFNVYGQVDREEVIKFCESLYIKK